MIPTLIASPYWPFAVLASGILFIVTAIAVFRFHAFIALMLAATLVGLLAPSLPGEPGNRVVKAIELAMTEFGSTAGKIAWVIALAAIIGHCLMESGAADRIVRSAVKTLGEKRAGWALMLSAFFLSIPVFFDTVFFLLIPLAQALAFRLGKRYLYFIMAMCGGGVITHGLVPPTPGPLVMIETLQLDLGFTMIMGILLGLPAGAFALFLGSWLDRRHGFPIQQARNVRIENLETIVNKDDSELPPLWLSAMPVALPVLLIAFASSVSVWAQSWPAALTFAIEALGNKNLAMAIGTAIALYLMASQRKLKPASLWNAMEGPIGTAGIIILITSAGGAFGAMIRHADVGSAIKTATAGTDISYILLAFLIASVMKIAQGSGTVSMITTSSIMAAIIGVGGDPASVIDLGYHPVYIFAAIAFGSKCCSWMNDSGFWIVCKLSGFTEAQTLKTWTVLLAGIGLFGLLEVLVVSTIFPHPF